jgi:phosphoglycolate phosphatase
MLNKKIDKKILAFDFDGTIADTKGLFLDSLIELQKKYSILKKPIEREYLDLLISEGKLKDCLRELKIPISKIPSFFKEFRNYFQSNINSCPLCDGIKETLDNLYKNDNYKFLIISSNKKESIEDYIKNKKIGTLFSDVYSDNFSFKKHRVIRKSIENELLDSDNIKMIYFGDEIRDINACKKCNPYYDYGLLVVSVTWGYQNKKVLKDNNPDFIIDKPKDIENLLAFIEF